VLLASALLCSGCGWSFTRPPAFSDSDLAYYVEASTRIDYPDVVPEFEDSFVDIAATPAPLTLADQTAVTFWDLSLQEAVEIALHHSQVLGDLGGLVLEAPESAVTVDNPAIVETNPRYGVEGALSAFDAAWSTQAFFAKNDRALNNEFFGGGTRLLRQDLYTYSNQLSKVSAVGTTMAARHNIEYDFNNAPGNNQPNLPWATNVELEVRQPLLQGAGVDFNRIAGPGAEPGVYNGVLIARINTDISLADFEAGVRDFVNDVETAYWELYFAYQDLDAKIAARDRALETWRKVQSLQGRRGGEPAREARAREQYFHLQAECQNALSGQIFEPGRPTTFRGTGGLHSNERRLRLLMGIPLRDDRLLRPTTEPTLAAVHFAWEEILSEALTRRVELRRQQWKIKRDELELLAAKNHLYPQLDTFGRYRWRGLGHDLIEPNGTGRPPFHDAFGNLLDGNFQEWQVGVEFAMPIGFRQAYAGVRNAELNLHRDHAILQEQRRRVTLELSSAVAEKDRAYALAQTNLNRRQAAREQLGATEAAYGGVDEPQQPQWLDLLLDAQRRLADADSQFYRALSEYMMAIKYVHYAKGSLLDYNDVYLTEGPWPEKAYFDAAERSRLLVETPHRDRFVIPPHVVSQGPYAQDLGSAWGTPAHPPADATIGAGEPLPPAVPEAAGAESLPPP